MDQLNKLFLVVITGATLVIMGLQVPVVSQQRAITYDDQAEADLYDIKLAISDYELDKDELPKDLKSLSLTTDAKDRLDRYEYNAGSDGSYELCATFKRDTSESSSSSTYSRHEKGRHCFKEETGFGSFGDYDYDFSDFGSSQTSLYDLSTSAKDTEVMADINAIHGHLEAYYATYGYYPSQDDLKNYSWRSFNMPGLDSSALEGPNGEAFGSIYIYTPSPAGCQNNCTSYTLSGQYSDGTKYTKSSL